jgi:hypothetical protein
MLGLQAHEFLGRKITKLIGGVFSLARKGKSTFKVPQLLTTSDFSAPSTKPDILHPKLFNTVQITPLVGFVGFCGCFT